MAVCGTARAMSGYRGGFAKSNVRAASDAATWYIMGFTVVCTAASHLCDSHRQPSTGQSCRGIGIWRMDAVGARGKGR
jgi:hypothetical protein